VFPKGLALGIFDYENSDFQWLKLDKIEMNLEGITGITFKNDKYWFVSQESGKAGLYSLDKNFNLKDSYYLQKTKDAHSLIPFEDGFLINDTANNRLNKIIFSEKDVQETIFWKYNDDLEDTVHLNSVTKFEEKLFVSLFGYRNGDDWNTAKNGKIIQIPENKILVDNLHHPHTLYADNESIYFLESKDSSIHKISKNGHHEIIKKIEGYVRGLALNEKYFYVGSSARRLKSKSRGTINPEEFKEPERYHSWVFRINRETLEIDRRDLTVYGAEIYDIVILEHEYNIQCTVNPIILRMWKYELEHLNDINSIQQMSSSKQSNNYGKNTQLSFKKKNKIQKFKNIFKNISL